MIHDKLLQVLQEITDYFSEGEPRDFVPFTAKELFGHCQKLKLEDLNIYNKENLAWI